MNLNEETSDKIEELFVFGRSIEDTLPMEISRHGSRVEIITGEQLQAIGANDITEALQMLVPGLFVQPKTGPFDYFNASLQGSRTEDILWLVDGVRITNRLYSGTTPLDTIPAHMVERVEVLMGGPRKLLRNSIRKRGDQSEYLPFGAIISTSYVGEIYDDTGNGQLAEHGGFAVVDLSAHYRFGNEERFTLGVRLQNLFDETYSTRVSTAMSDSGNQYAFHYLGVPFTAHLSLSHDF